MRTWTLFALATALLLSTTSFAERYWLRYRAGSDLFSTWAEGRGYCDGGKPIPPPMDWPCSAFRSDKPLAFEWKTPMAKSGAIRMVFDQSAKGGQYDLLYADSNANGDLKDEKPIRATHSHEYGAQYTPIKLRLEGEDGPVTYHLSLYLNNQRNYQRVQFNPACAYEGDVLLGGQKRRVTIVDSTVNGAFNDAWGGERDGDYLYLGEDEKAQANLTAKYLEADGKLYQVSAARDGAYVDITPAPEMPFGSVRAPKDVTALRFIGENGLFHTALKDGVGRAPAGTYRLTGWTVERKGDDKAAWKLTAQVRNTTVQIAADKEATLDIGEPLICKLTSTTQRGQYSFQQSLTGRAGESISIERDGNQAPAPKLTITNKDQTYKKIHQFEYG